MTPSEHRRMNTVIIVLSVLVMVLLVIDNKHSMIDCEERLFEKLTNMKAPKDIRDEQ